MKNVILTNEQFEKLKDADFRQYISDEWRTGYKFIRRGQQTCTLASKNMAGNIVVANYNVQCVRVCGIELKYKRKYEFTNSKSPF